jgi:hypothetical protein
MIMTCDSCKKEFECSGKGDYINCSYRVGTHSCVCIRCWYREETDKFKFKVKNKKRYYLCYSQKFADEFFETIALEKL